MKTSLVILNWKRPHLVRRVLPIYAGYANVGEVVLWNNGGERIDIPGIIVVRSSVNLGIYARFAAAMLCRHDPITFVDDDLLLPESTLDGLLQSWQTENTAVHGLVGRNPNGRYDFLDRFGPVEIVVGRCAVVAKAIVARALQDAIACPCEIMGSECSVADDIILSHAGQGQNRALCLPFEEFPEHADQHSMSLRPGHQARRTEILRWCRDKGKQSWQLKSPIR